MGVPWVIGLPAWGEWHIGICLRYAVPSLQAALAQGDAGRDVQFIVHTDQPDRMTAALDELGEVECYPVPGEGFPAFAQSHREVIALTPDGSNLLLHNADVIVSRETFAFAERVFAEGFRAVASVAHRCAPGNGPPIGACAAEVAAWHCANRHPIAVDCMWDTGKTRMPTNLFFERKWTTVLHCFHLGPTIVRKDAAREWSFANSVDYDLLDRFAQSEIYVVTDLEYATIEISPLTKMFATGRAMNVQTVADFGARRFTKRHLWLGRHQILVRGDRAAVDSTPAHEIIAEIERRRCAPS